MCGQKFPPEEILVRRSILVLVCSLLLAGQPGLPAPRDPARANSLELRAPAGDRPAKIDPAGETVLPNGRLITPRGIQVRVAPHPYGLALSPDGKTLVTANSGTAPFSFSIITDLGSRDPKVVQIPPGYKLPGADPDSVYMGVAIAPDNRTLYVAEGNNGRVGVFDLVSQQRLGSVSLDGDLQGKSYAHSLTGELKLWPDGRYLYVLEVAHFRLVVVDTQSKRVLSSVAVGRLPFALALSPDGKRAYVSNAGMFQYSLVPGVAAPASGGVGPYLSAPKDSKPGDSSKTGLDFPAFGFPSKEAEQGTVIDGKQIPGLGDPNVPESNSLWVIDVSDPAQPQVTAKIKTGIPVGAESVGGSSPGGVVAGGKKVFVSNANQDSITIIDAQTNKVEKTVVLEPAPTVQGLRGVLPFGLALSRDEKRLYVACAGINAVAVLDARKGKVLGYIPTGWFPARVEVSADGKALYVANAKGFGAGPNGGPNFHAGPEGTYIGDITKGAVSIIAVPDKRALEEDTVEVLRNNGFVPPSIASAHDYDAYVADLRKPVGFGCHAEHIYLPFWVVCVSPPMPPPPPPWRSSVQHIVYIVKENRTFDQVLGDLPVVGGERVEADPRLVEFGDNVLVENKETGQSVEHARVTPNHHALARRVV